LSVNTQVDDFREIRIQFVQNTAILTTVAYFSEAHYIVAK